MKLICLPHQRIYLLKKGFSSPSLLISKQKIASAKSSYLLKYLLGFLTLFFSISSITLSQTNVKSVDAEAAYTHTINERAGKIVATLNIADSVKAIRVRNIIANQYRSLNHIYSTRDAAGTKVNSGNAKLHPTGLEEATKVNLDNLHNIYLENLSAELSPAQVEQVKDGMTYGVVQVTYKGYQEMIPTLTEEQKRQIYTWLIEARELAMDAASSDKKHATFGKYKGRINNYLSATGYDLKKLSEEWHSRIKAEEAARKKVQ